MLIFVASVLTILKNGRFAHACYRALLMQGRHEELHAYQEAELLFDIFTDAYILVTIDYIYRKNALILAMTRLFMNDVDIP